MVVCLFYSTLGFLKRNYSNNFLSTNSFFLYMCIRKILQEFDKFEKLVMVFRIKVY